MRKMKDSGILWIGEIPEDWKLLKLKDSVDFEKGKNAAIFTQEYIGKNIGEYPVYSGQTQNDGVMGFVDTYDYDEDLCLFVTTVGAKAMSIKKLKGKFSLSQNCLIMKRKNDSNIDFLLYSVNALFDFERKMIPAYMQPSLRIEDLKKYVVYVPEKVQQQKIADFLDKKCAEIDKLIELQESMIEKLKEYKQSVITQAVTKGLDPDVLMKDSGIEWIGKIPEGWEIKKLKHTASQRNEKNIYEDLSYIGLENIVSFTGQYIESESSYDISQSILCKTGDVLFGKLRPYLAKVYLIERESCCSTEFIVLKQAKVPSYIIYIMLSNWFVTTVNNSTYGTKMPRANADYIKNVYITVPPTEEQHQIADYLDKKCAEIDDLIKLKEQKIEKLKEYKKSLIYEYVTGKKEVV